ncbi:type VII secretion integral membrane protein EccD [Kutzneria sp. CA-103260]|uniref:type VII secretion integral membrane protein EccD n=1 Tax=Kutzneria sp. CA-103260 TaxID=2802641 RepID=UPI001BAC9FFB|nr:type VII secretion integral membrane protein EccD [Kutzneria sp. CA-103260]QUQ72227.1 integral membrane protein [Kutzneria sp. CA-103260]
MISTTRRITVVTPRARVDVALPVQSTLAELVPQLVRLSGAEGQASPDNPGWVLSRLGDSPFPPGLTVAAIGLRDGEVLHLSPRERQVVPLLFDDVVDAIASVAGTKTGAWAGNIARRCAQLAAVVALLGAAVLLAAGLSGTWFAPAACGVFALVLLFSGGALARAYGDSGSGVACAAAGVGPALLAGLTAVPPFQASLEVASIAAGLAATTGYGVLAAVLLSDRLPWFGGLAVAAGFGTVATAFVLLSGVPVAGPAAVLAAVVTALAALAPMLALRLGKLPLPRVPADIDSFRAEEEPTLGPDVIDQTANAERILTGLLAALALAAVGGVFALLADDSPWSAALSGVLGLVWLLRSRSYAGTAQRLVLLLAGLAMLGRLGAWLITWQHGVLVAVAVLIVAAILCLAHATRVRRGHRSPYWSRMMDIAEFLGLIAIVPLVGAVLNVYVVVRGML